MAFTQAHANILADSLTDEQRAYLIKFNEDLNPNQVTFHIAKVETLKELADLEIVKWSQMNESYVLTAIGRKVVISLKK